MAIIKAKGLLASTLTLLFTTSFALSNSVFEYCGKIVTFTTQPIIQTFDLVFKWAIKHLLRESSMHPNGAHLLLKGK